MPRILLTPEDQKVVNRWRLIVVTIYSSIAIALAQFVAFSPTVRDGGSTEARTNSKDISRPWLRRDSKRCTRLPSRAAAELNHFIGTIRSLPSRRNDPPRPQRAVLAPA
jgi:hypothetical protein